MYDDDDDDDGDEMIQVFLIVTILNYIPILE
jgi:hypothetical protein